MEFQKTNFNEDGTTACTPSFLNNFQDFCLNNNNKIIDLYNNIGDLSNLNTINKDNLVKSINEIKNISIENDNNIGDLSNLNTESKNDLVSAINELIYNNKISYAKIKTNFDEKSFTNEAQVTGFINDINYGDYKSDAINNRIIIKNTEIVEINGFIGGNGPSWSGAVLKESETDNIIDNTNARRPLYQFGGNGYWSAPLPTLIYKLEKNKTYYLYLYSAGYNGTFNLNSGVGFGSTWISAKKIK